MYHKVNKYKRILTTIFLLFCPVIGIGYLILSWLTYQVFFKKQKKTLNLEELSFSKKKMDIISAPKLSEEGDKVPLEEALIVQDKFTKRETMLKLLKSEYDQSLHFLASAVENEDGEVSHYAASAVTERIAEFKNQEKTLSTAIDKGYDLPKSSLSYMNMVYEFLQYKILSEPEQIAYCKKLLERLKATEEKYPEEVSGKFYQWAVKIELGIGNFDGARQWVIKALEQCPKDIRAYKAGLEYYHKTESYDEFSLLLEQLKMSDIILDHQLLEMIRFYNEMKQH
jgi:tetratricopeptide (TPR) repeat protein